jgi:hypothetical protein
MSKKLSENATINKIGRSGQTKQRAVSSTHRSLFVSYPFVIVTLYRLRCAFVKQKNPEGEYADEKLNSRQQEKYINFSPRNKRVKHQQQKDDDNRNHPSACFGS